MVRITDTDTFRVNSGALATRCGLYGKSFPELTESMRIPFPGERERERKRSHFVCSQSEGSCSSPLLFYLYRGGSIMDFTPLLVLGTETIFPANTGDGDSWKTGCY